MDKNMYMLQFSEGLGLLRYHIFPKTGKLKSGLVSKYSHLSLHLFWKYKTMNEKSKF